MTHRSRLLSAVLAVFVVGAFLTAVPAWAHHSINAEYYPDKEWTMTGVLTKIEWINPHTVTWFAVKNDQTGQTENIGCEGGNPRNYSRAGLSTADWKVGEVVTFTCMQARSGSKTWGFIKSIQYHSDGHVLVLRHGPPRY